GFRKPIYSRHRRQPTLGRERRELLRMASEEKVVQDEERADVPPGCGLEGALEICGRAHSQRYELHPQCRGYPLRRSELWWGYWADRVPENTHPRGHGDDLSKKLQAFGNDVRELEAQAGDVPSRAGEAGNEASP